MRAELDYDEFYERTAPVLLRQLHAFTGDYGEAQDCVQEAYTRAWQRWSRISAYDEPAAWVRQVAIRYATNRVRKARNMLIAYARHGPVETAEGLEPDAVAAVDLLRRLPDKQRQALVLHHLVDMPVAEVARFVGTSEGTVKSRLSRGRAALNAILADEGITPVDSPAPDDVGSRRSGVAS